MHRNLILARGDEKALHRTWKNAASDRSWDIHCSYFGAQETATFSEDYDAVLEHQSGIKWHHVYSYLSEHPTLLDQYDYIWIPDDDIACSPAQIQALFQIMRDHNLDVAQPALTWDSHYVHPITLQNDRYLLRMTNFVEVMMPCFHSTYLKRILPYMKDAQTGWGLDFGWAGSALTRRAAILDCVAMQHTRPVGGGAIYATLKSMNLPEPWAEFQMHCEKFNVDPHAPQNRCGITSEGLKHHGRLRVACQSLLNFIGHGQSRRGLRLFIKDLLRLMVGYEGPSVLKARRS